VETINLRHTRKKQSQLRHNRSQLSGKSTKLVRIYVFPSDSLPELGNALEWVGGNQQIRKERCQGSLDLPGRSNDLNRHFLQIIKSDSFNL
jgi:hypothetical protein